MMSMDKTDEFLDQSAISDSTDPAFKAMLVAI
jgi:hypothetical protein